jgi:hypothetical protein
MRSLQSASLKARRTSIFHPRCSKHCAANKASPRYVLSGEHDASTGFLEKFRDCLSDTGASLVHQRLDLDAAGKCSLLQRRASAPKSKLAGPINPPDPMTRARF